MESDAIEVVRDDEGDYYVDAFITDTGIRFSVERYSPMDFEALTILGNRLELITGLEKIIDELRKL